MPALNPFLRALFQSSVLGPALPSQNFVLLVPTTDSLLYGQDYESGKRYVDQVEDEDFLGSHILRIVPSLANGKDASIRDARGKAKTYPTVSGRTVIIKENIVYTNKGFKQFSQAQLLADFLYRSPAGDMQQWLVYYISKPLTGTFEAVPIKSAIIGVNIPETKIVESAATQPSQPKKRNVKTFIDLLNNFPMIARQMQPGLDRLFNEFGKELGKPLPPPPSRTSTTASLDGTTQVSSDNGSIRSNGSIKLPFNSGAYFDDEEDLMRKALETAVTAAIDLFQAVDKQQLSLLGAATDLTGPDVEKLIERYVAESVHDSPLFPRLCSFHRAQDQELDRRIRQMECLDVSQVGIVIEDGRKGKQELLTRIDRGVAAFRKLGASRSPQEMLEVLLQTQKAVSESPEDGPSGIPDTEKRAAVMMINADVLVSLLLLVVIRSQVRHLQTRLSYMQRFIYIDDVESGEIGYALSTLEAVLTYLSRDAGGLRKASKQNRTLWDTVKKGKVDEIRSVFEGVSSAVVADDLTEEPEEQLLSRRTNSFPSMASNEAGSIFRTSSHEGGLAHVFPFQNSDRVPAGNQKQKKKVQLDARSMSVSSVFSLSSRTATIETSLSGVEGDTSVQSLSQTQDALGHSVLMMAVENQQPQALYYLLGLSEYYSVEDVLSDSTNEGASLLSAAVQVGNVELVDILLEYVEHCTDESGLKQYLAKTDSRGRSVAHYLFNTPQLITRLAALLPWQQKDKIGHTPLFAICRTYDHADYSQMVSDALAAATKAQGDGLPLRVEDHMDHKGNSLLHIVNDSTITHQILHTCDVDPNAMNDKRFTPLMLASKYGRVDLVRVFLGDPRIDLHLKEARGLTAVELAKDDDVRNRIDDLTLFSSNVTGPPDSTGRITAIVRSFFVEDGSTRFILKSGAPNPTVSSTTYTITTSRRGLQDFQDLAKWLSMDSPASYMPIMLASNFRTPFQIHSRPSRAVLYDAQTHLDRFLKILMTHPTFSAHEMLWEFFLVPDMLPEQMAERARLKGDLVQEKIADEYDPLTTQADLGDVELMVSHSREIVKRLNASTRLIIRRGHVYSQAQTDLVESLGLAATALASLGPPATALSQSHIQTLIRFASLMHTEPASSPLANYIGSLSSFYSTIAAVQAALLRPSALIMQIASAQRDLERHRSSLISSSQPRKGIMGLNLPGMEESRMKSMKDTENKITQGETEVERLGKELRYTQEVVVGELAGWTSWREAWGKEEIKKLARATIVKEKERLKCMQRALRALQEADARSK